MADNILASGISNVEHLAAFDKVAAARFAALEVEKVLIYVIDQVDADALYWLAEQFDLLGYRGWKLAKTEKERRELIKQAILLHRYKGTPYAIKEVLRSVGFPNCVIQEGISYTYNGDENHDGSFTYGGSEWATFRVIFDLGNDKGISDEQTDELVALVNEYKNVRSHLIDFSWKASLDEVATPTEEFEITMILSEFSDDANPGISYNGVATYNGQNNHKGEQDRLEVEIIS